MEKTLPLLSFSQHKCLSASSLFYNNISFILYVILASHDGISKFVFQFLFDFYPHKFNCWHN